MSKKNTLIVDNQKTNGLINEVEGLINEVEGHAHNEISLVEIAAVLYVASLKDKIEISLFKRSYHIQGHYSTITKPKRVKWSKKWDSKRIGKELKKAGWIKEAATLLKMVGESNQAFELTVGMQMIKEGAGQTRHFTVSMDKYNGKCRLHTASSPTHLLDAQNVFPLGMPTMPKKRADAVMRLLSLPLEVLKRCVGVVFGEVWKHRINDPKRVNFSHAQTAVYSRSFKNRSSLVKGLGVLHSVFSPRSYSGEDNVNVMEDMHWKADTSRSQYLNAEGEIYDREERNGYPVCLNGLMVRATTANRSGLASMGFYDKYTSEITKAGNGRGKEIAKERRGEIDRSIRLDLTLYKEGIRRISRELGLYKKGRCGLRTAQNNGRTMDYWVLQVFFERLFALDITSGVLYGAVLKGFLYMDQIFEVEEKHWQTALDFLKNRGYHDIVDGLGGGVDDGPVYRGSWTSLCKKQDDTLNSTRLATEIEKHVLKKHGIALDVRKMFFSHFKAVTNARRLAFVSDKALYDMFQGESNEAIEAFRDHLECVKMKADGAARTVAKSLLSGELKGLKTTRDLELTKRMKPDISIPIEEY